MEDTQRIFQFEKNGGETLETRVITVVLEIQKMRIVMKRMPVIDL